MNAAATNPRAPDGMLVSSERFLAARFPMTDRRAEVTRILQHDGGSESELLPLVYAELKGIAAGRMRGERADHTLQATALVHEAYVRLVGLEDIEWRDRRHFYGAAAEAMRRILIDHARKANSEKRGGGQSAVTLGAAEAELEFDADRLIELDDAFEQLAREDPVAAEVTKLRFFSGLSVEETAESLAISVRSVHRKWTYARARLFELLGDGPDA